MSYTRTEQARLTTEAQRLSDVENASVGNIIVLLLNADYFSFISYTSGTECREQKGPIIK